MPREDKHQTKAERNEQFAASLDVTDPVHDSWAAVAVFYSALHYVESYFARVGVTCSKHDERDQEIKRDPKIRNAYSNYKFLFTLSITARYKLEGLPPSGAYSQAKSHLASVKTQINHALGNSPTKTNVSLPERLAVALAPDPPRPTPGKPIG